MESQSCAVSPQGDKITIALSSEEGERREVTLSFEEASILAVTLPQLLTTAMNRRYSDETMRHVYPVHGHVVECAADQRHLLLTLSCRDDLGVVFAIDADMIPRLTRDLAGGLAPLEMPLYLRPH